MNEFNCHYCGCHTYTRARSARDAGNPDMMRTVDHVVPKCRGGKETVVCCLRCNGAKADGDYAEFVHFANTFLRGRSPRPNRAQAAWGFKIWLASHLLH